jgi:lipopolysaccharide transport system permease protein
MRHYIDVIAVLAEKDFKIRYKNSVLGFLWSLLNPLAYMTVLTLVFALMLRANIPNFAAWELTGIIVWRYFSVASGQSLMSIVGNPSLVSKIRVSPYVIVLGNNIANLIGAALEFTTLFPLLVLLGVRLTVYILVLPVILIMEFFMIFGLSLSLASLNLKYRDFSQLWNIALQLGFFLTPLVYDVSVVPARFKFVYSLNPVTRLIESAREILIQHQLPTLFDSIVIISGTVILLLIGFAITHKFEAHFAEEI